MPSATTKTTARRPPSAARGRTHGRADLEGIYRAAVAAVDPARLVAGCLRRRGGRLEVDVGDRVLRLPVDRLWVVGAGKAAVAMARGLTAHVPEAEGVVVAPYPSPPVGRVEVLRGSHPVPDHRSFAATDRLLRRLRRRPATDVVLVLLSGGASALLARPARGVSAEEKTRLGKLLLRCGADIELTNAVRKHVSAVKGGGLLRLAAPRRVVTLALSDVVGDALPTIGSGPTVADPTTYVDAWRGLATLGVADDLPAGVRRRLRAGVEGRSWAPETLKPGSAEVRRSVARVIGSNRVALRAAAREARRLGYRVRVRASPLQGEAALVGADFAAGLGEAEGITCVLAGGETTVSLGDSRGRGGRNQELAVAAMRPLRRGPWSLLAAGTDGIDGPTSAAGGFADGTSWRRAGAAAVAGALAEHDSHRLLSALGDAFSPGPTGTNVMDLVIAVRPDSRR